MSHLHGRNFLKTLCEAIGEDPKDVNGIVIDVKYDALVTIYVTKFTDDRLFNVVPQIAESAKIVLAPKSEAQT